MTTDQDGATLDDLFAKVRGLRPVPPDDLVARVLADAEAVARERPAKAVAEPRRQRLWSGILGALGGWPALGGLAASACVGLVLGVAQPAGLSAVAASIWGEPLSVSLAADADPLSILDPSALEG